MMDVARAAGVSHQTVSRVLNAPDSVRPQTRERVRAAIEDLGYRPNMAARALVTDSTRTIGVVTTGSHFHGPASTTAAIEDAARAEGYACLVTPVVAEERGAVEEALDFLVDRGVEGIVAVAPQAWVATPAQRAARRVPLVVVADGLEPGPRIHVVSVDQELGARMAVGHLLATGRQEIAHVAGPEDWYDAVARRTGWAGALEDAGAQTGACLVGPWDPRHGYEAVAVLAEGRLPGALFCANDLIALGALAGLRERGVAVPGEVAVVGYDDIAGAEYFCPSLSTVRQPFDELGFLCLEVLLRAIDGESGAAHSIAPSLRVRGSSAR
ncbi:MAG: LacI family DNA-binding transcriptional regulator [Actinomyces sp.]|uniref:LacI family DNA-binding transcriptional regulator n=1 Tax=Actinomyces sp. TaxID=29317 RepID=UPI0026DC15E1|nr:LacI family DNA-binding transcriptional regulator [Actinomyces sp.]MDO4242937.1 LacI family DNA-binding transcriptional regulator [Actinomyces sp.]